MYDALISVIVPIYNVAPYLDRCVSSLVNQTYRNLEILLVDDGSTDESGQIADAWGAREPRIVVFHKEHGGPSSARNYAIDRAQGQYLSFVDSDDFVDETFIQVLYETLVSANAQISVVGFQRFTDEKDIVVDRTRKWKTKVFEGENVMRYLFNREAGDVVWNKLFARELFDGIRFPVGRLHEDVGTTCFLFGKCARLAARPAPLYFYFQRAGSIVHTYSVKHLEHNWEMHHRKYQYIKQCYPDLLDNDLALINHIFDLFPYLSAEHQRQAAKGVSQLVKHVGHEVPLNTKLKCFAIQTVPNLHAWNKKRKIEKKRKHVARNMPR